MLGCRPVANLQQRVLRDFIDPCIDATRRRSKVRATFIKIGELPSTATHQARCDGTL
jgi:hypothetical protein